MSNDTKVSSLWRHILDSHITSKNVESMDQFKRGPVNFKLSLWNPERNGIRYLKMLVYNIATSLTENQWKIIRNTKNRDVGKPISVNVSGQSVCLDYIQSSLETEFILGHTEPKKVIEIGAGYGRTCHTLMENTAIEEYTIVDLPECLNLGSNYLQKVLNEKDFKKIKFISAFDYKDLSDEVYDLCINIDSFAEMDSIVVSEYLSFIDLTCKFLYVKNPVGKYWDPSLDGHFEGADVVEKAISTGVLTNIVEIHNDEEVLEASSLFLSSYSPGEEWQSIANSWAQPITYYWQSMFQKEEK